MLVLNRTFPYLDLYFIAKRVVRIPGVEKYCIKDIGLDPKCYGLHSLRSGGITSVVHHSGNSISDRLSKLHGRWNTEVAKDMYVHDDVHKRLEITKYLGLWFVLTSRSRLI